MRKSYYFLNVKNIFPKYLNLIIREGFININKSRVIMLEKKNKY